MRAYGALLMLAPALLPAAAADQSFQIRGRTQAVAVMKGAGKSRGTVLFLPGDGGWRGLAVTMAQSISNWGYTVYGFDTKRYLETFSEGSAKLTPDQMGKDLNGLIGWIKNRESTPVTVLGWSQGAGMGVLAASTGVNSGLSGLVTLGLPKSAVLGWDWKDMLSSVAHLEPAEPYFDVEPLLRKTTATPVWMIYGSADEYTDMAATDRLFAAANQPKRIVKVPGANHRFDTRRTELYQALQDGLLWVDYARQKKQRRIAVTAVSLLITGAALWFVCRHFEWATFAAQAKALDRNWVAAAVLADILSYVCQGARWSVLLSNVAPTSVFTATRAVYAGLFVNELLPMRPGEVLRGMIVARHGGHSLARIVPSMVAERVIDACILVIAGVFAASYVRLPKSVTEFVLVAGGLLVLGGGVFLFVRKRIPAAWLQPFRNRTALLVSTGVLLGQCVAVWCILRACGLQLPFAAAFAITVILRIGTALPLAPANVGTHQLAMLLGLAAFGISGPQATAVAFIVFALLTLPLLTLGALAVAVSNVPAGFASAPPEAPTILRH